MSIGFQLESFDAAERGSQQLHPEYLRGFEAGQSSAVESNAAAQNTISREIVSALADADFTYVEARQAVLSELTPILNVISSRVLPLMATAGLSSIVLDTLTRAVSDSVPKHPTIAVHPDQLDALTDALSNDSSVKGILKGDSSLPVNSAWLSTASGETSVDFESVIEAIKSALGSYTQPNHRKTGND